MSLLADYVATIERKDVCFKSSYFRHYNKKTVTAWLDGTRHLLAAFIMRPQAVFKSALFVYYAIKRSFCQEKCATEARDRGLQHPDTYGAACGTGISRRGFLGIMCKPIRPKAVKEKRL